MTDRLEDIVAKLREFANAREWGQFHDPKNLAMAVASVIFAYQRKAGLVLLILAACVGIARVAAQVHHPIDVIGSTLIAIIITFLCYRVVFKKIPFPVRHEKAPIR